MILKSWTTKRLKDGDYEYTNHFSIDGVEVLAEEYDAALLPPPEPDLELLRDRKPMKPMVSDSAAVHPDQIPEAMEHAKLHGVPTEFNKDGCPIFATRDHQRRYAQIYGYHNNDDNWSGKDRPLDQPSQHDIFRELDEAMK